MTESPHFTALIDALEPSQHLALQALDIVTKEQGVGTPAERQAEWLPLFFMPHGEALRPVFSTSNEDPEEILKHNAENTPAEQWDLLRQRAPKVQSALLRGRYSDFLWRTRQHNKLPRPHEFALQAVTAYELAIKERLRDAKLFWDALSAAHMFGRIGRELNRPDLLVRSMQLIGELVDAVEEGWRRAPGWLLRAGRTIADLIESIARSKRTKDQLHEVVVMLDRLVRFMPAGHDLQNSPIGRGVFELRSRLESLLGKDTRLARQLEAAESLFAEAQQRARPGGFTVAGALMVDAVQLFSTLGMPERASLAKRLAREYFDASVSEMHTSEAITTVDTGPTKAWMAQVLACNDLRELLGRALDPQSGVLPSWHAAAKSADDDNKRFTLQAMMPTMTVVDGRPISRESDGTASTLRSNWTLSMLLSLNLQWRPLVEELKRTKGLTADALLEELRKASVVAAHNVEGVRRALNAALTGDHLVACHMLPPLIESALRWVLSARGVDMTAFRPREGGQLQERTMGALFGEDGRDESPIKDAITILGEDLWNWYRAALFDEAGMNLRNRSAHGLLSDAECTPQNADLLLLGLVALLRLPAAKPS
jgi:hypothetical protein